MLYAYAKGRRDALVSIKIMQQQNIPVKQVCNRLMTLSTPKVIAIAAITCRAVYHYV